MAIDTVCLQAGEAPASQQVWSVSICRDVVRPRPRGQNPDKEAGAKKHGQAPPRSRERGVTFHFIISSTDLKLNAGGSPADRHRMWRLLQVVDFDQGHAGGVVHTITIASVGARCEGGEKGRFLVVGGARLSSIPVCRGCPSSCRSGDDGAATVAPGGGSCKRTRHAGRQLTTAHPLHYDGAIRRRRRIAPPIMTLPRSRRSRACVLAS